MFTRLLAGSCCVTQENIILNLVVVGSVTETEINGGLITPPPPELLLHFYQLLSVSTFEPLNLFNSNWLKRKNFKRNKKL